MIDFVNILSNFLGDPSKAMRNQARDLRLAGAEDQDQETGRQEIVPRDTLA